MTETSIAAPNSGNAFTAIAAAPAMSGGPIRWFDQKHASGILGEEGVKLSPKTLQKARSTGIGSPPWRKVLGRVVYEEGPLRAWAKAQRSPLVHSTSELAAKARKAA